jgi:ABC-type transport system involved in multi-copper enzyme maturation permease subunit
MNLWITQALTVMRVELKRYVLARRWIGVYLAAYAPVAMLLFAAVQMAARSERSMGGRMPSIPDLSEVYAFFYQTFMLRLAIFFSCALVFSQLFRGEVLEKTLHFYLLSPVRREVIAIGKFLAGTVAMALIFSTSTILTNLLMYAAATSGPAFFFEGNGIPYLLRYLIVTVLACTAYGGVFTLTGLRFRNPVIPAIIVGLWEAFYFFLPETLQKLTIMHYLQSLLPLIIDRGPFSVVVDASSAVFSVLVLIGVAALLVWASGKLLCRTEVTYSSD